MGARLFLHLPQLFRMGPFIILTSTIALAFITLPVCALLVREMFRNWKRRERLQSEIAAAREVQSALMPAAAPRVPGFEIQAAYLPADEVGGDFYQVLPSRANASWILVGDVSGKGLKAAMVVSIVAGAAEAIANQVDCPSAFLAHVNAVLAGRLNGGFVTCCCVRLEPGGAYTVANAGHVPPYIGGVPLSSEAGLPLGVACDANWDTASGFLRTGERLVLVSDGVVEARNAAGELYGFERTRELTTSSSATEIADTARAFGQEDDITVITIERVAEVAHAA